MRCDTDVACFTCDSKSQHGVRYRDIRRGRFWAQHGGTISLFGDVAVVVGVHGASLSNALFAAPGAPLVEVTLPEPFQPPPLFSDLAAAMSLHYWPVDGGVGLNGFRGSVVLDVGRLATIVEPELLRVWQRDTDSWGAA